MTFTSSKTENSSGDRSLRQGVRPALRLQLLFDSSLSITTELGSQQEAAIDFLRVVVKPRDRVSVLQVSENVVELVRDTSRPKAMAKALRSIRPRGGTSLYDAVYLASQALSLSRGRRVILIISDGTDTTSKVSMEECLRQVLASEAVVYVLLVQPIKSEAGRNLAGERSMIYLTRETGGRTYFGRVSRCLAGVLCADRRRVADPVPAGLLPQARPGTGRVPQDQNQGGPCRSPSESAKRLLCNSRGVPARLRPIVTFSRQITFCQRPVLRL